MSLVATERNEIINTERIMVELGAVDADSFEVPFWIRMYFYRVPPPLKDGKPKVMSLHDYNGDGLPLEFVLYGAESGSLTFTS